MQNSRWNVVRMHFCQASYLTRDMIYSDRAKTRLDARSVNM